MNSYLVCYDIEDDRERTRVAHLLEGYGERVQYSVFEVHLVRREQLAELKERLRDVLGQSSPDVRFYRLTADGIRDSSRLDGAPVARRDLVVIL